MSSPVLVHLVFCHVFPILHIYEMVLVNWICVYTNTYKYLVSTIPHTFYFLWSGPQILSPLSLSSIHHPLLGTRIFENKYCTSQWMEFCATQIRWQPVRMILWPRRTLTGAPENREPLTSNRSRYQIITKDSSPYAWRQ
jgi:hypothetical protein